jgi:hypothetical protein
MTCDFLDATGMGCVIVVLMKSTIACLLIAVSVCAADDVNVTIAANESAALVLTVPQAAKVTQGKEKTEIETKNMNLCVWAIAPAKTVDEGVAQISEVIKHEVVKFVAARTNIITVAGAKAKHLIGRGVEAYDEDPATADVVVFAVGKSVFAACVHGEGNQAVEEREPMLAVLQTARAP